uniref:Tetraspanin n=1 Tax=Magallana gigas TaxID=29159 RepID=A0A8W8KNE5_MAGGI|nr:uncharacterized protein LOC105331091 [Crassostrea gigas]XP_034302999.1 uncharacterized protein LOC105331091 [Crassostrea gigas]XP_034303000.1 uncharacterized protein LOC105331091 [Crassostrea gigas]XP_034303001.1 uncharacterized protein LOC105331091 [Crassostrea gigas]XP_034303002.1 uncharacterized protein LOC105331091 [Crassostrea gigas]XP_034303003.1 uncharacterized protein LOC105331091 [Crassostrea gigas]XP_034303004.1 uncharacterized protein LOC105331091 [Crassostrea gigas]XP_03430300
MNNKEQHNLTEDLYRNVATRTCHTLLALKGILLVAAIVLISSTKEISIAKSCDLEKVLVSFGVDQTSPCKYDDIKKKSTNLCTLGILFLVLNGIIFLLILNFLWIPKNKKFGMRIALVVVYAIVAAVYSGLAIKFYKEVLDSKERQTDTNFSHIKTTMMTLLMKNYTSDNVTSGDAISDSWNKFFIEYDCCAINQVTGTTNDFDSTPWCTTSGSCQATASQIPKTCCNGVSEDDYESAPTTCHSSVNPGTFRSNCMIPIKKLSTINIGECQISLVLITLLTIGTLGIAEFLLEGILISYFCCLIRNKIWPPKKEETEMDEKRN